MQLAAKLGDHDFVKFLLRKQCATLWIWGPVTQHSLDLAGIDSAGDGGGDLMELVSRVDAVRECTSLLLDSFLQGFLYKLFVAKWTNFGWKIHVLFQAMHLAILSVLLGISMRLKSSVTEVQVRTRLVQAPAPPCCCLAARRPDAHHMAQPPAGASHVTCPPLRQTSVRACAIRSLLPRRHASSAQTSRWLAVVGLALISASTALELTVGYLFHRKFRGTGDARLSQGSMLHNLLRWAHQQSVDRLLIAHLLAAAACVVVLSVDLGTDGGPRGDGAQGADEGFANASGLLSATAGGALEPREDMDVIGMVFAGDTDELAGALWITLALAILATSSHLADELFAPFESLCVLAISVGKMLKRDLSTFLLLFGFYGTAYYFTLYVGARPPWPLVAADTPRTLGHAVALRARHLAIRIRGLSCRRACRCRAGALPPLGAELFAVGDGVQRVAHGDPGPHRARLHRHTHGPQPGAAEL